MILSSSLLIDNIDIITASGIDYKGKPTFVTVASGVPARVEFRNRQTIDFDATPSTANVTVFMDPPQGFPVDAGDQIKHDSDHYLVLEVRKHKDDIQVHHYELLGQTSRRLS